MRKVVLFIILLGLIFSPAVTVTAQAYDFGNFQSQTLAAKAWQALEKKDIEAVLAYTNKCIELYADKAKEMQAGLKAYPAGDNDEIFAYWALNDVATVYFIQGEAYRRAKMPEEAKKAYAKTQEYSFGQCWDTGGWFWKPAEAAKEKLARIESGATDEADFSDNSSSGLTAKAWQAFKENDLDLVKKYVGKCLELYEGKAKEMQASLDAYAWESKDKVFSYWALNDVGTSLYILGKAYEDAGKAEEANKSYERLVKEFKFAQCWDPGGWFWKPAEDAEKRLQKLN
ncbi:MAG: hypothetical protein A2787_05390 [Omnitrophica WOR_2 bacterium RIFCSPHIGHO2_01_FULL_48_9]|nr:MAG: hypothetical protein A3D10_08070 [Omnitrophica WOR_2 bacterium RIFCSPHIGHO2_02_FULL_48_11]OGX32298.1 MAG: hypothetical protein A2787_05390 [Omnitrophica WOR_2 bacterium RIFCSPHIGHO2_01_FULL_48_9]